jgi:uncharacterized protein (DUF4415 family)
MSEKNSKNASGRSEHGTDFDALAALTDEDIDRAIEADPTAARSLTREWFENAEVVRPGQKRPISIRLDKDVLDYFQADKVRGYQSRINAALRRYVQVMRAIKAEREPEKARR